MSGAVFDPRPADLRLRLVALVWAVAALSQIGGLRMAGIALGLSLGLALLAPVRLNWHRLLHLEAFLILLFATLPFTVPGHPLAAIGPFTLSAEGLSRAATLGARTAAAVILVAVLLGGTDPARIGAALRGLGLSARLVQLFGATARYLSLTGAEARRARDAMRARGFRPRSNRHSWRSYGYLIGRLILRALARAERVEEAMRARGYAGRMPTPALARPGARDWVMTLALGLGATALWLWDHHA